MAFPCHGPFDFRLPEAIDVSQQDEMFITYLPILRTLLLQSASPVASNFSH